MTYLEQYTQVRKQARELTDNDKFVAIMRLGDFFEAFGDDAETVAEVCGITMHYRRIGKHGNVPMAGFPTFSADKYIAMLIAAGYSVAAIEYTRSVKHGQLIGVVEDDND